MMICEDSFYRSAFRTFVRRASATVNEQIARVLCAKGHEVKLLGPNSVFRGRIYESGERILPCDAYRFGPRLSRLPGFTINFLILILRAIPLALAAHVIVCEYHNNHMASLCAAITSIVTRRPLAVRVHDLPLSEATHGCWLQTMVGGSHVKVDHIVVFPKSTERPSPRR